LDKEIKTGSVLQAAGGTESCINNTENKFNSSTTETGQDNGAKNRKRNASKAGGLPLLESQVISSNKPVKGKAESISPVEAELIKMNIDMLLAGGFSFLGARLGDYWNISDEEAIAISSPLTRIIQRMSSAKTVSKYMDYFSLLSAVGMTVGTRLIVMKSEKKEVQTNVRKDTGFQQEVKRSSEQNVASDTGKSASIANAKATCIDAVE